MIRDEVTLELRESGRVGVRAHLEGVDLAAIRAFADGVVERLFKGLTGLVAMLPQLGYAAGLVLLVPLVAYGLYRTPVGLALRKTQFRDLL